MAIVNKQICDPSGRILYVVADDHEEVMKKVEKV